ncbi:MAG: QueT transporter family protein [Bacilli bacterium]|nr:QueT transporter family protein [Bacilli bacterium]
MSILHMVKLALVSALYVVFTVIVHPLSYGAVQFRFAEILVLLCFFRKDYAISIIIGCFIANLFSPILLYDITFGTFHTIMSVILIGKSKQLWVAALVPVILMPIIGLELTIALKLPFFITTLTCMLGEAAVLLLIGVPLFTILRKNNGFLQLIEANQNWEKK